MGEVAKRFVLHLAVFSVTAPQQGSYIDLVFVFPFYSGYVGGSISRWHTYN
jgi:hypothetical protein